MMVRGSRTLVIVAAVVLTAAIVVVGGSWIGIGRDYANKPKVVQAENRIIDADEPPGTSPPRELIAHHEDILSRLQPDYIGWCYAADLSHRSIGGALAREVAVRLDLLYHVEILPNVMQRGDWFPFLMISPDGTEVHFVFPKSDGQLKTVRVAIVDGQPEIVR